MIVFNLFAGSSEVNSLGQEGRSTCKGKILAQNNPWCVFDLSSVLFLAKSSIGKFLYTAYVISATLERFVTVIGYSLLKFNWKKIEENDKTFKFKKHVSTETSVIFS